MYRRTALPRPPDAGTRPTGSGIPAGGGSYNGRVTTKPQRPALGFGARVVLGIIALLLALTLIRWIFLAVFGFVKLILLVALIGFLVALVLFGFGGRDDRD
ncbi:MAG: hypothetical protein JJLCMIEE_01557 [Acidimicrobiales bacterium]|nr:hypothetical protein [Acidimicrobiales bacterium]